MKNIVYILLVVALIIGCHSTKTVASKYYDSTVKIADNDTVTISNDELKYEIIIIEPGFNVWLMSRAKPEGYYSQNYLETKNVFWVSEWNNRVLQPARYGANLYEMRIDYEQGIDYGYEVNYKLYNYLVYFQLKNNQRLGGGLPRI